MKAKILIITVFLFICHQAYCQRKAATREGIQNKGDLRIKILYPFTPTIKQGRVNYELNADDSYDNFEKTASGYYNFGIQDHSYPLDTNMYFHEQNRLVYRGGLGIEYCLHKRFPIEFGIKTWRFRKDWDTNFVAQKGYFQHISFPLNIRYELFRRKFISLKAGLGVEPYIKSYRNFTRIQSSCTRYDIFLIFPVCAESRTFIETKDRDVKDSYMTGELSLGLKLSKRLSMDIYARASQDTNYSQINLNYLIN